MLLFSYFPPDIYNFGIPFFRQVLELRSLRLRRVYTKMILVFSFAYMLLHFWVRHVRFRFKLSQNSVNIFLCALICVCINSVIHLSCCISVYKFIVSGVAKYQINILENCDICIRPVLEYHYPYLT